MFFAPTRVLLTADGKTENNLAREQGDLGYLSISDEDWRNLSPPNYSYPAGAASPCGLLHGEVFVGGSSVTNGQLGLPEPPDERDPELVGDCACCIGMDKANFFSALMTDPDYVSERAKDFPIIKAKMELMKRKLHEAFPDMNDDYWTFISRMVKSRGRPDYYDTEHYHVPNGHYYLPGFAP